MRDIRETIRYWQDVLGFPDQWTWGDPPDIGAVSWQTVHVQFVLQAEWRGGGCSVWIRVRRLESLYRLHQERKADIVELLENKPWGMAQYTVREINGHYLCFAGLVEEREKSTAMPSTIRITGRLPGVKEFQRLQLSVGWGKDIVDAEERAAADVRTEKALAAAVYAVVAENTVSGEAIGCALLLGDGVSFYYVKDVMVDRSWQGRGIGTALMRELTGWLEKNAKGNALVGLFARDSLEPFYKRFGFTSSFAMLRYMNP